VSSDAAVIGPVAPIDDSLRLSIQLDGAQTIRTMRRVFRARPGRKDRDKGQYR